jgi:hypothetical protein
MPYKLMPVYNIDQAVGQGAPNLPPDVRLIQTMLNELSKIKVGWAPQTPLPVDGVYTPILRDWIIAYQKVVLSAGTSIALDGRVDPMKVDGFYDWSASFGGSVSTMFTLNWNLRKRARNIHDGLASRLGILEKEL